MRKGWMVFLVMILTVSLLTGCGSKQQPVQPVNTVNSGVPSPELDLSLDKVKEELRVNEKEDMNIEEIRRFIQGTDNLMRILQDSGKPDRSEYHLIGTINDVYVLKYNGEYDSMEKVMLLLGDYFSPRAAEKQLLKWGFVNLNGKIGHPLFSDEGLDFFIREEKSRFKILEDGKDHKVVEITVIGHDSEQKIVEGTVRYVLDRVNGRWLITEEIGFYDDFLKNPKIQTYITEWDSDSYSPHFEKTEITSGCVPYVHPSWVAKIPGGGIGEWVKIESQEGKEVSGVEISNGYEFDSTHYPEYNRVKRVKVELSDGSTFIRNLKDELDYRLPKIDFGRKIKTNFVKITILEVYKGSEYDDTTYISEVRVY